MVPAPGCCPFIRRTRVWGCLSPDKWTSQLLVWVVPSFPAHMPVVPEILVFTPHLLSQRTWTSNGPSDPNSHTPLPETRSICSIRKPCWAGGLRGRAALLRESQPAAHEMGFGGASLGPVLVAVRGDFVGNAEWPSATVFSFIKEDNS